MSDYRCRSCGRECEIEFVVHKEPYEFWGAKGVRKWEGWESTCCGADPIEEDAVLPTEPPEIVEPWDR